MLSDFYNLRYGNSAVVAIGASTSICAIIGLMLSNLYLKGK
jgi:hypothetical protein